MKELLHVLFLTLCMFLSEVCAERDDPYKIGKDRSYRLIVATVGQSIMLNCTTNGHKGKWFYEGNEENGTRHEIDHKLLNNSALPLVNIGRNDEGRYYCVCNDTNKVLDLYRVYISVTINASMTYNRHENGSMTLNITVTSDTTELMKSVNEISVVINKPNEQEDILCDFTPKQSYRKSVTAKQCGIEHQNASVSIIIHLVHVPQNITFWNVKLKTKFIMEEPREYNLGNIDFPTTTTTTYMNSSTTLQLPPKEKSSYGNIETDMLNTKHPEPSRPNEGTQRSTCTSPKQVTVSLIVSLTLLWHFIAMDLLY